MKITAFPMETATEAPTDRQRQSAGASVGVRNEETLRFQQRRPQRHQPTGSAGLLVPSVGIRNETIAFPTETDTEAPADRQRRSAGALCGHPQ